MVEGVRVFNDEDQGVRRWKKLLRHSEVAYKESAEEIAAHVATLFAELGNLAALDYSRAYDHMRPTISKELLKVAGVPEDLVDTLVDVWQDQMRYVQFDGHTSEEILEGSSAQPQGGPWGPPLMQLWMTAGAIWTSCHGEEMLSRKRKEREAEEREVSSWLDIPEGTEENEEEQQLTAAEVRIRRDPPLGDQKRKAEGESTQPTKKQRLKGPDTRTYMDDRSIVAAQAETMLRRVQSWIHWSGKVELIENKAKNQLLAKRRKSKEDLKAALLQGGHAGVVAIYRRTCRCAWRIDGECATQ